MNHNNGHNPNNNTSNPSVLVVVLMILIIPTIFRLSDECPEVLIYQLILSSIISIRLLSINLNHSLHNSLIQIALIFLTLYDL